MDLNVNPTHFVVNIAHTGLKLKANGPCFRLIGAFYTGAQAQAFSDAVHARYDLDCIKIKVGATMPIFSTYEFMWNSLYTVMKIDEIKDHHKTEVSNEHAEFVNHKKELQSKKDKEEKLKYAQTQTKKMVELRKADKRASMALLENQSSATGREAPFEEKFKGIFNFMNVSFMQDPSAKREHTIQVHSVHRSFEEGKKHTEVLAKQITDKNIYTLEMYQWIHADMAFCEHLMEKIPRVYRDQVKNELMQYQLVGKKKKREDIAYEHNKLQQEEPTRTTIEPDLPDLTATSVEGAERNPTSNNTPAPHEEDTESDGDSSAKAATL